MNATWKLFLNILLFCLMFYGGCAAESRKQTPAAEPAVSAAAIRSVVSAINQHADVINLDRAVIRQLVADVNDLTLAVNELRTQRGEQ